MWCFFFAESNRESDYTCLKANEDNYLFIFSKTKLKKNTTIKKIKKKSIPQYVVFLLCNDPLGYFENYNYFESFQKKIKRIFKIIL